MYKVALFDLDGTLTDPKAGITRSVRYALDKFDIPTESLDDLDKFIGPPLKQSFMKFYSLSEEQALLGIKYYREYFSDRGIYENELYEGIPDLLQQRLSRGMRLAVATSKPTVFAEKIIRYFGLDRYFEQVIGSNMDNTRTGKGEVIAYAMERMGCQREETLMAGDRKHDIIGARENGIDSIGLLYGYGSRAEITAAGPDYIAETVEDFSAVLAELG